MGIFGFASNLLSGAVKVVVSPIAVVKDIAEGEPFETTSALLSSAADDILEAPDELMNDDD